MAEFAKLVKRCHNDLKILLQEDFSRQNLEIEYVLSHYECVHVQVFIYVRHRSEPKGRATQTRAIYIRNYDDMVWVISDNYPERYNHVAEYLEKRLRSEKAMKEGLKQEIAAAVWRPERVAKWIEAGVALEDL